MFQRLPIVLKALQQWLKWEPRAQKHMKRLRPIASDATVMRNVVHEIFQWIALNFGLDSLNDFGVAQWCALLASWTVNGELEGLNPKPEDREKAPLVWTKL